MTELDKIKRAEMYLRKMAEGINPLTDEYVSEDDMINNVRITRCLYYVSDILQQVIANDGVVGAQVKQKKQKKSEFYITDEQQALLTPFGHSVFAKDIVEKINEVTADNNCKKFAARWIGEYFVSVGMIEVIDNSKIATDAGKNFGIQTEKRRSMYGKEFWANKYSPDAQRFIIDNLEAIAAFSKSEQYQEQRYKDK